MVRKIMHSLGNVIPGVAIATAPKRRKSRT